MSQFWLIRHGESEGNRGLPSGDTAYIPLTDLGKQQAQHTAKAIPHTPDLIVSSPYLRAQQTAQPTLERFPEVRHETWPVQEFTYLHIEEGRITTMNDRYPMAKEFWERNDPHYIDGPNVESYAQFVERIEILLEKIQTSQDEFTLIYSHGLFIRAVAWFLLVGSSQKSIETMSTFRSFLFAFGMPNCGILKIEKKPEGQLFFSPATTSHLPSELLPDSSWWR